MEKYCYGILLLFTLLLSSSYATIEADEKRQHGTQEIEPMKRQGFGISVSANRPAYSSGEMVSMTLCVFNNTGQEVTLHFKNAQRYDFTIEDEEGKEVWRWSNGRMFAQVLGDEIMGPGREELIYTVKYQGKIKPGKHRITGSIKAMGWPITASLAIEVK